MATILQCPKCGADVEGSVTYGVEHDCKFCGAKIVFEAPPPVVVQQVIAPEVIHRVVMVDPNSGATSLACPRCTIALFEGKAGEQTIHGCGTCGGVWLDNLATQSIVDHCDGAVMQMSDRAARAEKVVPNVEQPAKCPVGGELLSRVDAKGVTVDVCATHGTWFDAGELRRVAAAYANQRRLAADRASWSAGGATYDYSAAAEQAIDNQRYAEGAIGVLSAILSGLART